MKLLKGDEIIRLLKSDSSKIIQANPITGNSWKRNTSEQHFQSSK